jgi:hypothetical protein
MYRSTPLYSSQWMSLRSLSSSVTKISRPRWRCPITMWDLTWMLRSHLLSRIWARRETRKSSSMIQIQRRSPK